MVARHVRLLSVIISFTLVTALTALATPTVQAATYWQWSKQASGTSNNLLAVSAVDSSHVWAVGAGGTIRFYNGVSWTTQASGTTANLYAVYARSANQVWAAGDQGRVLFFNGTTWSLIGTLGATATLYCVYATATTNVWVAGRGADSVFPGQVWQFDGGSWTSPKVFSGVPQAMSGYGANHIWLVMDLGLLYLWDGATWTDKDSFATVLGGVTTVSNSLSYACGGSGIYRYNGTWAKVLSTGVMTSAWAEDASHVWCAGYSGDVRYYDGGDWTSSPTGGGEELNGVTAGDADHAWVVGDAGVIYSGTPATQPPAQLHTWYLAEGSNAWGFFTGLCILNPNNTAVTVRITVMPTTGSAFSLEGHIPAERQMMTTVDPADYTGDFSTKFECLEKKPIAVARVMLWDADAAQQIKGDHSAAAVPAAATTWYLPEGSSNWGFECYLLIQNPDAKNANCDVTYMIEGVGPKVIKHVVPANSRMTYKMNDEIGPRDASIKVVSDQPVISERAMYRNSRREGHESMGTTAASQDYYLAEGSTAWGYTTYILIQNPNSSPTDVTLTYMTTNGPQAAPAFTMSPDSRMTVRVNDTLQNADFSTKVHGSLPIIAERAMYWNNGTGEASHDSIGLDSPHKKFYLAYGERDDEDKTQTWTLVQNPNSSAVKVRLTYYPNALSSSSKHVVEDTVPANSRKTYEMPQEMNGFASGVVVESLSTGMKIMVEQSTYNNEKAEGCETIGSYSD
ncbi:MAG: WD40/YVTN/BNR-like repeat-containing protein [Candidatus Geothermincolia bacterium]